MDLLPIDATDLGPVQFSGSYAASENALTQQPGYTAINNQPVNGGSGLVSLPGNTIVPAPGMGPPSSAITVGGPTQPATASTSQPATGTGATPASPTAAAVTSSVGNYFIRGVIIILGFIFIAVGLSMFKNGGTVSENVTNVRKTAIGR